MKFWLDESICDKMPTRNDGEDAGFDFYLPEDTEFKSGCWTKINSGICSKFDSNIALIAQNKSGIAQMGLIVGACVVDSSYEGNIHLHLYNTTPLDIYIEKGKKIVQFVPFYIDPTKAEMFKSSDISKEDFYEGSTSTRGDGGFGSTQIK